MTADATILYVDPYDLAGHRVEHLVFYLRVCHAARLRLSALVPEGLWRKALPLAGAAAASGHLACDFQIPYPGSFSERLHALDMAALTAKAQGAALIYFPVLDFFWLPMLRRRLGGRGLGTPWSGVIFNDHFNFMAEEIFRPRRLIFSLLKIPILWFLLRGGAKEMFTFNISWKTPMPVPVTWLPDAFSQAALSQEAQGGAGGMKVWPVPQSAPDGGRRRFLMTGAMAPRKGLIQIAQAFLALTDSELLQVEFRALGKFIADDAFRARAQDLFAQLRARGATVELRDGFIPDDELDAAYRQCDYILVPYIYHLGSSGVMGVAAQYGRPLLSQNVYQMGSDVRRYGLGLAVKTTSRASLVRAIRSMLAGQVKPTGGMREFDAERTPERAQAVLSGAFLRMTDTGLPHQS